MSINVNQKGKRVERNVAKWLKEKGCTSAHRTQQYCGTEGTSDVTTCELKSFHIESKATRRPELTKSLLKGWLKQLSTDCPDDKIPVIVNTPNNKEAVVLMLADDYVKFDLMGFTFVRVYFGDSFNPGKGISEAQDWLDINRFFHPKLYEAYKLCIPVYSVSKEQLIVALNRDVWFKMASEYDNLV